MSSASSNPQTQLVATTLAVNPSQLTVTSSSEPDREDAPIVCIVEWGADIAKIYDLDFGIRKDVTFSEIIRKLRTQMGLDGDHFDPPLEWEVKSMQSKSYIRSLREVYVNRTYGGLWVRVFNIPKDIIDQLGEAAHKLMEADMIAKGVKINSNYSSNDSSTNKNDPNDSEILDHQTS